MSEKITVTPKGPVPSFDENARIIHIEEDTVSENEPRMTIEEFTKTAAFQKTAEGLALRIGKPVGEVMKDLTNGMLGSVSDTGVRAFTMVDNLVCNTVDLAASLVKGATHTVTTFGCDAVRTITLGKGNL